MNKLSKILTKIFIVIFVTFFIGILIFGGVFFYNTLPVNEKEIEKIEFKIESGWGKNKIAEELKERDLVKSDFFTKLYFKINAKDYFIPGTFLLSKSMNLEEICHVLTNDVPKEEESISLTLIEGKRFPYYVDKIASTFNFKEDDILKKTSDREYLQTLIKKYWFITDDILNNKLYYPLEGYIFPDTYLFKKSATIDDVLNTLLDGMDKKLKPYKELIQSNGIKIHDLLTMASMVELEAVNAEDRAILAGVFENRLDLNMSLGSDVTTYYASKKELTEPLTKSDLDACNAYNTRGTCVKGLPVGPIACVSLSSIEAAIKPTKNDYLYFVADTKNDLYFAKNESEHIKNINNLKTQGLWPE